MGYAGQIETSGGTISPIGSTLYGVCNTAASSAAKVVVLADYDELITGTTVHVKFLNGNTAASPTLEVGGTAAKPIYVYGTTAPGNTTATSWAANSMISFTYDGTAWRMNDVGANNAIISLLESEVTAEASARATAVSALATQFAAAYSNLSTYAIGDLCIHDDKLYICNTAITTAEEWDSTHWTATNVSTLVGKTFKFTDVSVAVADFVNDSTYSAQGFVKRAAIPLTGVTAAMIPYVVFGMAETMSGDYAPLANTYDGGVYIYAEKAPAAAITIPLILCKG